MENEFKVFGERGRGRRVTAAKPLGWGMNSVMASLGWSMSSLANGAIHAQQGGASSFAEASEDGNTPHFRRRVCAMARQTRTLSCPRGAWRARKRLGLRRASAAFEAHVEDQNASFCIDVEEHLVGRENGGDSAAEGCQAHEGLRERESVLECGVPAPLSRRMAGNMGVSSCVDEVEKVVSRENTHGGGIVTDRGFYTTADHQVQQSGAYTPQSKTLSRSRGSWHVPPGLGLRRDIAAFETIGGEQNVFYCVGVVERVVSRENAEVGGVEQFASGAASEFVVSLDRHPQQSGADTPQSKTLSRTPMSGDYPAVFGLCNTAFAISDHGFGQAPSPLPVGYPPFTGSKSSGT